MCWLMPSLTLLTLPVSPSCVTFSLRRMNPYGANRNRLGINYCILLYIYQACCTLVSFMSAGRSCCCVLRLAIIQNSTIFAVICSLWITRFFNEKWNATNAEELHFRCIYPNYFPMGNCHLNFTYHMLWSFWSADPTCEIYNSWTLSDVELIDAKYISKDGYCQKCRLSMV